jgi:hypothetical protein
MLMRFELPSAEQREIDKFIEEHKTCKVKPKTMVEFPSSTLQDP